MTWTVLTRRTEVPKLTWIMSALTKAGIDHRLNGKSFHAPILETSDAARAELILAPVDSLPDDDAAFVFCGETGDAWWLRYLHDPRVGDLLGALGVAANAVRTAIALDASCVPDGADERLCPLATGVIEACPASLWGACQPLVRLETFCLSVAEVLPSTGADAVADLADGLIEALQSEHGPDGLLAGFVVLASWLTDDLLERLTSYDDVTVLGVAVSREIVVIDGAVVPLRSSGTTGQNPEAN